MAEPRFFHPEPLVENLELILSDSASHHAGRVLRLKPGDEVVVFDGSGKDYSAKIIGSVKGNLHLKTNRGVLTARESPVMTELAQGISSADKMDFTLQKAVELGVGRIVPLLTHKCLTRLTHDKVLRRLAHWRQIVISACE
ncbi:MAG: 16S rRNA (uracil(1498)-N(3))-methyltransferase, partial [Pseudomonadota bacterium]|nr:16S rRNA (uracil(1498)-N(3))-methyltransferase [Pseudomonadota bacterium]